MLYMIQENKDITENDGTVNAGYAVIPDMTAIILSAYIKQNTKKK